MLKPIEVSNLNHCSKHGYRFKNLSWQTTSEISKYITSLEADKAQLREALKKIADGDYDPLEEGYQDIARAALKGVEDGKHY
jgi:hypothetical protein